MDTTRTKAIFSVDPRWTSGVGVSQTARVSVDAGSSVHPQTMAAAARRAVRNFDGPVPEYVDTVTGERRPGKWSTSVVQVGKVRSCGYSVFTQTADYSVILVPA